MKRFGTYEELKKGQSLNCLKKAKDDKLSGDPEHDHWMGHLKHVPAQDRPHMLDMYDALTHVASEPNDHKHAVGKAISAGATHRIPLNQTQNWESHNDTLDRDHQAEEYAKDPAKFTRHPIIVAHLGEGRMKVLDGQHRFNQAKKDGKSHIKAFVMDISHWKNRDYHK